MASYQDSLNRSALINKMAARAKNRKSLNANSIETSQESVKDIFPKLGYKSTVGQCANNKNCNSIYIFFTKL